MLVIFIFVTVTGSSYGQTCFPLDNSFGINGQSAGITGNSWMEHANTIVQPDNKILQFSSGPTYGFITVRYKANGGLDSSFGQNGRAMVSMGISCRAYTGILQADGKIVIAGAAYVSPYRKFGLVRLNANGTADLSFGVSGVVISNVSPQNDEGQENKKEQS